jgi:hypothetical protein
VVRECGVDKKYTNRSFIMSNLKNAFGYLEKVFEEGEKNVFYDIEGIVIKEKGGEFLISMGGGEYILTKTETTLLIKRISELNEKNYTFEILD